MKIPAALAISALVMPMLSEPALAQAPGAHWTQVATPSDPPLRRENPGAADDTFMYVFGGKSSNSGGVVMNDLWRFDGATWTQMNADGAAGAPPARFQAGVTWDFGRDRLVVFGGRDVNDAELADTWEWDPGTNTWSNVTPASSPTNRRFCALAYDYTSQKVLLFAGLDGSGVHLNDSWHWDGTAWTQLSPAGAIPQVRRQHFLVERPEFQDIIMTGGQEAGGAGMLGDTWRWDGAGWTQILTTLSPAGNVAADAAYDPVRQRLVIAGGNPGPTGTISEFDSLTEDWVLRPLDTGIYKVTRYFAAYVPATGKIYKVSGQALNALTPPDNTYEYQSDFLASYTDSGSTCPGVLGTVTQTSLGLPWIGSTSFVGAANIAPSEIVLMVVGLNNVTWAGNPLPLNLGSLGAPGCFMYLAPTAYITLGQGPGIAPVPLFIPNNELLLGVPYYTQTFVLNTTSTNIGSSNLKTGVIGIK